MTREELRLLIREVISEATTDMRAEVSAVAQEAPEPEIMTVENGLLAEKHLRAAASKKLGVIRVAKAVVVTPLARDAARSKGIRIERID